MKSIIFLIFFIASFKCYSQGSPAWEHPLNIAWSPDGTTFSNTAIFQDSAGVPSVTRWKGDTLVAVFQWFRQPMSAPSWDRVAVKFSYDLGLNWTQPVPIVVNSIPVNFQRPFDPAITVINNDSLRIYYSSSDGMPTGGLDSTINTYSAVSSDGVNYSFELNPRFDHPSNKVIDPSVIYFNGSWQYTAPIGAPQDGAFHCTSSDGINFTQLSDYPSDNLHNWTGNFMINDSNELRFYGSGQLIWFNSSNDGTNWQGFVPTNIHGGDPAVLKISDSSYFAIYTGPGYVNSLTEALLNEFDLSLAIDRKNDRIRIKSESEIEINFIVFSVTGITELSGKIPTNDWISITELENGIHFIALKNRNKSKIFKLILFR